MAKNEPTKPKDLGKEAGASGTILVNGIITGEEYNTKLTWQSGLKVYDEMRKSDATVRSSLLAVKLPILSADWFIKPASEDPNDQMIAEFVEDALFTQISFQDFLKEALNYLDFGFGVFEKVYKLGVYDGKEYITLEKIAARKQQSIYFWETSDRQPGVQQYTLAKGYVDIPMPKLLVLTNDKEGDNYAGVSILRSAYQHWYIKKSLYIVQSLAHQMQGMGVPILRSPQGANNKDLKKARELVRNTRANQERYIELPVGFDLEFLDMHANSLTDMEPTINHHDRQINKNVLAQFLEIGSKGSSGSYSASNNQSDLFIKSLESIAKYIAEEITTQVIKQIVELNWPGAEVPCLEFDQLTDEDVTAFAEAINKLASAGIVTPDPDLEEHIRTMLKLPEKPEEEMQDQADAAAGKPDPNPEDEEDAGDNAASDEVKASEKLIADAQKMRDRLGKELENAGHLGD